MLVVCCCGALLNVVCRCLLFCLFLFVGCMWLCVVVCRCLLFFVVLSLGVVCCRLSLVFVIIVCRCWLFVVVMCCVLLFVVVVVLYLLRFGVGLCSVLLILSWRRFGCSSLLFVCCGALVVDC